MKIQTRRLLAALIVLLFCIAGATAAGTGVLSASNVTDVALNENGTVTYTLTNDFDPRVGSLNYTVYYDETIATAVATETIVDGGVAPDTLESGMPFSLSTESGVDNDGAELFTITFTSLKNDGSSMDVGIVASNASDTSGMINYLGNITIQNGTFTTKDEVAPVIENITTPNDVGINFPITGYITEMGEMGAATATLANGSATEDYDLSLTELGDGVYTYTANASWDVAEEITLTVNAEDAAGNTAEERSLQLYVNDGTSVPTLDVTITDSDGDGFVEANEDLTFGWEVSDPGASGFREVQLLDTDTEEIIWSSPSLNGSETTNIDFGNRDLSFRAYDNSDNFAAHDFHLYNNYVVWLNTTKIETMCGLNTEFTSAVDFDRTATSMVTLYNGRNVSVPDIGTVTREVRNVGQVTSDTYVTVDERANATYPGSETYDTLWLYNPSDIIDFEVTAPAITHASVVMVKGNGPYIQELIGSKSTGDINYTKLLEKTAYIFFDGGWTQVNEENGSFIQEQAVGEPLTVTGNFSSTLKNTANQVNISSGFRMSTDCVPFDETTNPDSGCYAIVAIAFDGDRIGGIAAMPVCIPETADEGTLSTDNVSVNGSFNASFSSDCKYFGVGLYRDTEYDVTASVDFANLNLDMIGLNLSMDGAPTTKFWRNIYVTPGAGKYAYVKNASSLTFDVGGLEAGSYKAVLAGLSNNGTTQAFGVHDLIIGSPDLKISDVSAAPCDVCMDIQWATNIESDSTVEYGTTDSYGKSVSDQNHVFEHSLRINGLAPATEYHYRIISVDESGNRVVTDDAVFVTESSARSGGLGSISGGGGGYKGGYASSIRSTVPVHEFNTTASLQTDSNGTVRNPILISSADGLSSLYIAQGVQALKASGQPVGDITLQPADNVPSSGSSAFSFADHAVTIKPSGATFGPAIELTFQLTEEEWGALNVDEAFTIKWFNDGTGEWEDVVTSANPAAHTVTGQIEHFSTFAVFKQSVESLASGETQQSSSTTDVSGETSETTETGGDDTQSGGFPWVWVIVVIALIAIIGSGYYYTQQK